MYGVKVGCMRVVSILLILLLIVSPVEASNKIIDYKNIEVDKVAEKDRDSQFPFSELLKIDFEIESLIKENTYKKRNIYEFENELKEEQSLLEELEMNINFQRELINSDNLVMQIFRATKEDEEYLEKRNKELKEKKQLIEGLKEHIESEEKLISLNEEEISFLFSEREKYFTEKRDYISEDLASVIQELESMAKVVSASDILLWPLKEYGKEWISSYFGIREVHPITKERNVMHNGIDIAIPFNRWPGSEAYNGAPVYILAATDGVAYSYETSGTYGNYVVIINDKYTTVYAHTHENLVESGQIVRAGEVIAIVGSTGLSTNPHLHFEVHINGSQMNPLKFLKEVQDGR